MDMGMRDYEPVEMHEDKPHKKKRTFSKTAKGWMRLMVGMSALVASIAGLVSASGYLTYVRRNYPRYTA